MYKNPDNDQRGVCKSGDMSVKTYSPSTDYPIAMPSGRIVNPPAGRYWRVSKEKFEELVADNRIWFGETGNNVPSVKRFLSEVKDGVTPLTVWTYEEVGHNQEAKKEMVACFNVGQEVSTELLSKATPKPVRLLSRSVARGTGAEGQGCRRAGCAGQTGRVRCYRPYSPVRGDSQPDAGCRSEGAQTAARSAITARDEIQRTLTETTRQIDDITAKLKDGLKVTFDADTTRFDKAIADLDKALAEKEYLLQIQADLQEAEKKLKEYEQLLKEGKTLPVDADVSKTKEALDKLKTYVDQNAQFELKVATEKAQAAITNVEGMIKALDRIQTESQHQVASNVGAVRAESRVVTVFICHYHSR